MLKFRLHRIRPEVPSRLTPQDDPSHPVRQMRVELLALRHSLRLDLWTGLPLAPDDRRELDHDLSILENSAKHRAAEARNQETRHDPN